MLAIQLLITNSEVIYININIVSMSYLLVQVRSCNLYTDYKNCIFNYRFQKAKKKERKKKKYINLHISSAFGLYCLHEVILPPAMSKRLCKNSAVAFRINMLVKHSKAFIPGN